MGRDSNTRSGMLWEVERILFECKELNALPQILVMENVPQVHSTKNKANFDEWQSSLKQLGYTSHWQDLNTKDFGLPQNRNRTFMVSILGDYDYEFPKPIKLEKRLKDLLETNVNEKYYLSDKQYGYIFDMHNIALKSGRDLNDKTINNNVAKTISCRGAVDQRADVTNFVVDNEDEEIKIYDVKKTLIEQGLYEEEKFEMATPLQKDVCNKALSKNLLKPNDIIDYTYSNSRLSEIGNNKIKTKNATDNSISCTLTTNAGNFGVVIEEPRICASRGRNPENPTSRLAGEHLEQRIELGPDGLSNCLTTVQKDNYLVEPNLKSQLCNKLIADGLVEDGDVIRHSYSTSRMNKMYIQNQVNHDCSPTLDTRCDCLGVTVKDEPIDHITSKDNFCTKESQVQLRIRKLTPRECFRLQGVKDSDFEEIAKSQSDASLYHLAGDSISSTVLMAIFSKFFSDKDWKDYLWEYSNERLDRE